eukprot:3951004-Amphidinium_carterae.1
MREGAELELDVGTSLRLKFASEHAGALQIRSASEWHSYPKDVQRLGYSAGYRIEQAWSGGGCPTTKRPDLGLGSVDFHADADEEMLNVCARRVKILLRTGSKVQVVRV